MFALLTSSQIKFRASSEKDQQSSGNTWILYNERLGVHQRQLYCTNELDEWPWQERVLLGHKTFELEELHWAILFRG